MPIPDVSEKLMIEFTDLSPISQNRYRIEVSGRLGTDVWQRFGAMQLSCEETDGGPVTILQGLVKDQSELLGILNTLHDLHLPLRAVERLS